MPDNKHEHDNNKHDNKHEHDNNKHDNKHEHDNNKHDNKHEHDNKHDSKHDHKHDNKHDNKHSSHKIHDQKRHSKSTQVHGKSEKKSRPCPRQCTQVPINVPDPGAAQQVLHPRKDVFVLKVAKVGAAGDRRCKMELELVTPKGLEKKPPCRVDTRETQCDSTPPPCICCGVRPSKKKKK